MMTGVVSFGRDQLKASLFNLLTTQHLTPFNPAAFQETLDYTCGIYGRTISPEHFGIVLNAAYYYYLSIYAEQQEEKPEES